ncbi:hypothetical protein [Sulfobacillus thermosulfidooxidans]|uniref:hypothetical protein n=1 Tax=Sulfobacillus thermosulfidooxidans TaxID=28034 RepID=UPI0006B5CD82|nr:hypothetical protein [Sulfobacillus thermosulfidooxidans]
MIKFQGAKITEQGVTFGIVVVQPHVLNNTQARSQMQSFGHRVFGLISIVLMAQIPGGQLQFFGRQDIVGSLANVPLAAIPLAQYNLSC